MNYDGPGRYQHYKGGEYDVVGLGMEEATHRIVVIYIAHAFQIPDPGVIFWTRPLDDFNAMVVPRVPVSDEDQFKPPEQTPSMVDDRPLPVPRFRKLYT